MNPGLRKSSLYFCALIVLLDAFALPDIRLGTGIPALQLIDFIVVPLFILILPDYRTLTKEKWVAWVCLFAAYMVIPIAVNGRILQLNDYFELYKILKLGILYLVFKSFPEQEYKGFIKVCFLSLMVINFAHFYNVFHFNEGLKAVYGDSIHFQLFGKNSLGQPAVKRMLGTMGNPNTNALLFLFFAVYYFPKRTEASAWSYFLLALFMVFLCQSRTSLIAVSALVGYWIFSTKSAGTRSIVLKISLVAGCYVLATALATSFFKYSSYSNTLMDGSALFSTSLRSRWESWKILWSMIVVKPLFGYAPFKSYFVHMKLYSDNEYLLMWWRYGIFGLLFYLGLYLIPLWNWFKSGIQHQHVRAFLFVIVMLISALTNNPVTERSISVLFVFILSTGISNAIENEETLTHR